MAKQPRVWDGSQWQELAVQLPDLSNYSTTSQMNTSINTTAGLNLITSQTFTGQSSVQFDNCFTSTYDNYRVILSVSAVSADGEIRFRYVDGTSPISLSNYFWACNGTYINNGSAYINYTGTGGTTYGLLNEIRTADPTQWAQTLEVYSPQLAVQTKHFHAGLGRNATYPFNVSGAGAYILSTQFEGIQFYPSAGTFGGTISIYGYKK